MKTVVIFTGYYVPHLGGIERYVDNLSKKFVENNINTVIVTSNYDNGKNIDIINNVKIIKLPIYNLFKNRYPLLKKNKEFRSLIKELDNYEIDSIIVNTRFHLTSHIGASYGKKKNIPVYLIEHGSNYVTLDNKIIDFFANKYEDFLTYIIKNKIKKFYGVSNACGEWLKNFKITSSGTWYNSIDCNQTIPNKTKHTTINFLYAGRILKQKGVSNVLEAFSLLEKEYDNIRLFIAGDGSELEEYKSIYKSKKIKFLGKLDYKNLLNCYAKTDIFLYPPLWPEGLPTSILEAGLMKCAVIGTNQGGIKEILIHNKNGLIVKEDMQSLYNAMKELIVNKDLRNNLAIKLNKDIKQKFSWENTAKKIIRDLGVK